MAGIAARDATAVGGALARDLYGGSPRDMTLKDLVGRGLARGGRPAVGRGPHTRLPQRPVANALGSDGPGVGARFRVGWRPLPLVSRHGGPGALVGVSALRSPRFSPR